MKFSFGGISMDRPTLKDMMSELEKYFTGDDEITYRTKKVFEHREEGLDFDYRYYIRGIDMRQTGEPEYSEKYYYFELLLVPEVSSLHPLTHYYIVQSAGMGEDFEIEAFDVINQGLCVPMLNNEGTDLSTEDEVESKVNSIANFIEPVDRMRGFYLDRQYNRIGHTGWDKIKEAVLGEDWRVQLISRIKSSLREL